MNAAATARLHRPVGVYLVTLIDLRGLDRTQVAASARVGSQYAYQISKGAIEEPSLEKVRRLVKAVQGRWLDVGWLLSSCADADTGRVLAEARFRSEQGQILETEHRAILARILADPEIADTFVVAASGQRGVAP